LRQVANEAADQRTLVYAFMLVEALVLGRDKRLLYVLWNISKADRDSPLVPLMHLRETFAFEVEHLARAGQAPTLEARMIGKVSQRPIIEFDHLFDIDDRVGDCLVLAELSVGGIQVGDFDPAECHITSRGCLRVIHGGSDQIVDIDSFDVKCAPHSFASGAQEVHCMLLIRNGIEGCPWFRFGRDLTECQSNSEYLDKDSVHLGLRGNWVSST
jgi:hypothetical protein